MHTPPVTSRQPLWTRGKDSPNPFGRFALRALFIQPPVASRQPLRGTGKGFPEPLRSLRSESRDFVGIIYNSIPNLRLCQRSRWRSWRPGWRK